MVSIFDINSIKVNEQSESEIVVTCGVNKAVIHAVPFKIDFYNDGVLSVSTNAKGLFHFEHLRKRPVNEYGQLHYLNNFIYMHKINYCNFLERLSSN